MDLEVRSSAKLFVFSKYSIDIDLIEDPSNLVIIINLPYGQKTGDFAAISCFWKNFILRRLSISPRCTLQIRISTRMGESQPRSRLQIRRL